jgi:uncharacterized protein (DUF1501 family)
MLNRRTLLKRSAFLSLAPMVPGFLARTAAALEPRHDDRVLVVVQLDGGNDGINTVVPFGDENYARLRRELRLPTAKLCKLGDGVGLHPAMRAAADLMQNGRLAIVQGVGYPNPNRSHFESMAIWQTARVDHPADGSPGWLGRALDAAPAARGPAAVHIGDQSLPRALFARRSVATSFADASDLTLTLPGSAAASTMPAGPGGDDVASFVHRSVSDAYATAAELQAAARSGRGASGRYPATELARRLDLIARSLKSGNRARVYYVIQPGYDSHAVQMPAHDRLLRELSGALKAFLEDLATGQLADRVLVLCFSEFGRRPEENGSLGTDHGTAGPVFLAGSSVRAGLAGKTPLLGDLQDGDLRWSTDFRSVYATILERWLAIPSAPVLGGRFEPLPILRA